MNNLKQNQKYLRKAIISTVAFFDIFDYPLTTWEIWKWLYWPDRRRHSGMSPSGSGITLHKLNDILEILANGKLSDIIESKNGFYFFKGREDIIQTRLTRYQLAEKKYKIALKVTKWLRWITSLKLVAVCNDLAYSNAPAQSDIDFFIIAEKKRIWFTRLLVTLIVQLLGLRRYSQKVTDRICLSFYLSEEALNLEDITLKPIDSYLYYWLVTVAPIYDQGIYQKFLKANSWVKKYLPNLSPVNLTFRRNLKDNLLVKLDYFFDNLWFTSPLGDFLEKLAKALQLKKMKKNTQSGVKESDSQVIVSDQILKFHEKDRRQEFLEKWQEKLKVYESSN